MKGDKFIDGAFKKEHDTCGVAIVMAISEGLPRNQRPPTLTTLHGTKIRQAETTKIPVIARGEAKHAQSSLFFRSDTKADGAALTPHALTAVTRRGIDAFCSARDRRPDIRTPPIQPPEPTEEHRLTMVAVVRRSKAWQAALSAGGLA